MKRSVYQLVDRSSGRGVVVTAAKEIGTHGGVPLGWLSLSHGTTPTLSAQRSYCAVSSFTLSGIFAARSCCSVRSVSRSYSSQGPPWTATSFHLPCRTARLPSCSQK